MKRTVSPNFELERREAPRIRDRPDSPGDSGRAWRLAWPVIGAESRSPRSPLILVSLCAALSGCAAFSVFGGDGGTRALQSFLSVPPADRVSSALVHGDSRYLAVGRAAPCAPEVARLPSRRFSIPGSEEAITTEEHRRLEAEAREYACSYNEELATLLGEAPP
jgi:hypothetical protein